MRSAAAAVAAGGVAVLAGAATPVAAAAARDDSIQQALQRTADALSVKYNMSIAVAFSEGAETAPPLTAAAGYTDAGLGIGTPTRAALPDDVYVWGSVTKMFTAPAVLRLVEDGVIASLDDAIPPYIDPFLRANAQPTLEDHFGPVINNVTVRHLLHMESGISDYDGEAYAKAQFANKSRDFTPLEILSHYVPATMHAPPGTHQSYCSTNYILLGMLVAHAHNVTDWSDFRQRLVFPTAPGTSTDGFNRSVFADAGPCSEWTPVHGILEGYSTASLPKQDVWNVSCVGGWTAGNYLGPVADVAEFTFDLYGPGGRVVAPSSLKEMVDFGPNRFYGMGTFNLEWTIGESGAPAYGHVGDTYGYQSQTTYVPNAKGDAPFVVTVATNVETNSQAQPAEATCLLVNAIQAVQQGSPAPNCTFVVPHRFIGKCTCE